MITLETFRTHRHSPRNIVDDPDVLVIRRGYRVRLHGDHNAQPWEIWRSINIARLHALDYQSTQRVVFTGNSSLLLHGIPTWSTNSWIEAWPSKTVLHLRPFPAVRHRQTVVPGTPVISRSRPPRTIVHIGGLEAESPIEAVVPQRATSRCFRCLMHGDACSHAFRQIQTRRVTTSMRADSARDA